MRGKFVITLFILVLNLGLKTGVAQTLDLSRATKIFQENSFGNPYSYAGDWVGHHYIFRYDRLIKLNDEHRHIWTKGILNVNSSLLAYPVRTYTQPEGNAITCHKDDVYISWASMGGGGIESGSDTIAFSGTGMDSIVVVAKYDPNGKVRWIRTIDKGDVDGLVQYTTKLAVSDSILLLSFVDDMRSIKVFGLSTKTGNTIWEKRFFSRQNIIREDQFSGTHLTIQPDSFGSFYMKVFPREYIYPSKPVGPYVFDSTWSFSPTRRGEYVLKLKAKTGAIQWMGELEGANYEKHNFVVDPTTSQLYSHCEIIDSVDVHLRTKGRSVHLDTLVTKTGNTKVVITRYDSTGTPLKSVYLSSKGRININFEHKLNDSTILFCGKFEGDLDLDPGPDTAWVRTNEPALHFDGFFLLLDTGLNYKNSYHIEMDSNASFQKYAWTDIICHGNNINGPFYDVLIVPRKGKIDIDLGPLTTLLNGGKKLSTSPYLVSYDVAKLGVAGILSGPDTICVRTQSYAFSTPQVQNAIKYRWHLPKGVNIIGDSLKNTVDVQFTEPFIKDSIYVVAIRGKQKSVSNVHHLAMPTTSHQFLTGDTVLCKGDTVSIASDTTAIRYYHNYLGQWVDTTTANRYQSDTMANGSHYFTDALLNNGCRLRSDTLKFIVYDLPEARVSIASSGKAICDGEKLFVNIKTNDSFDFYVDGSFVIRGKATRRRVFTYQNQTSVRIEVTDTNGCSSSDQDTVTVWPLPNLTAGNDSSICYGDSFKVYATANFTHFWGGGLKTGQWVKPKKSREYIVVAASDKGCYSNDTQRVVVHALPTVQTHADTSICQNSSLELTATGAMTYEWSPASYQHNTTIYPDSNLQLVVSGTDTHQCRASDTLNVIIKTLPSLLLPKDTSVCLGDSVTLLANSDGVVTWGEALQNGFRLPISKTEYQYAASVGTNGCVRLDSMLTTHLTLPTVIAPGDTQVCENDSVLLIATGGVVYEWSSETSNNTYYSITKTEELWVKGTDDIGCSNYDTLLVEMLNNPMVWAGNDTSFCAGESMTLQASGASTYQWIKDLPNGSTHIPFASERLWVKGTAANGCSGLDTLSITLWANPVPLLGRDTILERDASVKLYPGHFASYQWSTGSTDSVLNVGYDHQGKGLHQLHVKVATGNGCEGADTIEVEILETGLAEAPLQYRLYPNPANQYLVIWVPENGTMYQLYDTRGALTSSGRLDKMGIRLDISGLAPGVYQMKLVDKKGSEAYEKVVVY